jgi:hypothetical protein
MNPQRIKNAIRQEVSNLLREQIIDASTHNALMELYPATRWDFSTLGRWFLFFGALSLAAGISILGMEVFKLTLENLAIALSLLIAICFYSAFRLGVRDLLMAKRALELIGALTIIGLTFTIGVIYSSGSGNWPALLLIDLAILLTLAYLLRNVLILVLNVIVFFTWFGGVTGYISGWGAYFFGMNYPMRFLIAGLLMAGMSVIHRQAEQDRLQRYDGFFKVWLSGGIFFSEMALWLMSLFGNYGSIFSRYIDTVGELIFFNTLWAVFNAALLWIGNRYRLRMLRGYAMTFIIIQLYTLFFWKIAGHLGGIMATFVAGAVTLALVLVLESKRRSQSN